MSDYNFDFTFVKSGAPVVTLSAIGIAFNAGARSMLGYPEQVEIGYDEKAKAIGVRVHKKGSTAPAYEFEGREKDNWVRIGAKDFCRYMVQRSGIDFISKAKQFIPTFDEANKTLIVIVDKDHMK